MFFILLNDQDTRWLTRYSLVWLESETPRENAIAERVNGILKTEWLNEESFIGIYDTCRRISEVIDSYNNKRPHLSLNDSPPRDPHKM